MKIAQIEQLASPINLEQLAQIKGGTNDSTTSATIIIVDVDVI